MTSLSTSAFLVLTVNVGVRKALSGKIKMSCLAKRARLPDLRTLPLQLSQGVWARLDHVSLTIQSFFWTADTIPTRLLKQFFRDLAKCECRLYENARHHVSCEMIY